MPKITRAHQKVFCGDVPSSGNIAQFGSLKAGSPLYTDDPATIQALTAWGQGWAQAVIQQKSPALQDFNAIQHLVTRQLAYMFQMGIPEYHASTVYYTGGVCQDGGAFFVSKTDNNAGNATSNTTHWKPMIEALSGAPTARAWGVVNGQTGNLVSGYNVSSTVRLAAGDYQANLSITMPSTEYLVVGNCHNAPSGGSGLVGSNNIFTMPAGRTTTMFYFRSHEPYGGGGPGAVLEDAERIHFAVFSL